MRADAIVRRVASPLAGTGSMAMAMAIAVAAVVVVAAMAVGGCGEELLAGAPGSGSGASPGHAEPADMAGGAAPAVTERDVAALIGAPPKKTRTIAALMFDLGMGPPNMNTVLNGWMGTTGSTRLAYLEASYGMQDINVEVLGPYTLPVANKCLTLACCGPSSDRTGQGAEVMRIIASLPKTYDHYFWTYGPQTDSGCGTWGDVGNPNRPAVYSSFSFLGLTPTAQELGHNLGMEHEHTLSCGGQTFADDPSDCSTNEYGSAISFMGGGRGHPSGFHKAHQGWLSGCNVVNAGGSGRFTILPLEIPCDGTQLVRIPMPKSRNAPREVVAYYWAELRTPQGFDRQNSVRVPMVLLYAGPALTPATRYADHTFLLDLTPTTVGQDDAGLRTAGQSFQDPAGGLTITLEAIDMNSATINVTAAASGAHTCEGGAAFTEPGPGPSACTAIPGAGGAPGTGGATGTGGRAGTGGAQGTGGRGTGGAAGSGGAAGTGGASSGGAPGTGGATTVSSGGAPGSGGATSTGGATTVGSGGATSATGGATSPGEGGVGGGCSCSSAPAGMSSSALVAALAALLLVRRRRPSAGNPRRRSPFERRPLTPALSPADRGEGDCFG
jgi:MYXO-CTERM domain-containing protein